jgi:hypothetical protein
VGFEHGVEHRGSPTSTTTPKTTRLEATPTPTPTTANTTDRQDRVTCLPGLQVTRSPVVTLTRSSVSNLVNLPYDPACLRRSPTNGLCRCDDGCDMMDENHPISRCLGGWSLLHILISACYYSGLRSVIMSDSGVHFFTNES